jgi:hypothetical protein
MSWNQLLNLIDESNLEARAYQAAGPVACPNDGSPLERAPDGILQCPFDAWRPDTGTPYDT